MLIPRVKIESMGHGCQKQSVVDGLKMNGERNNPHSSKGRYAQATVERLQAVVKARAYEKNIRRGGRSVGVWGKGRLLVLAV